MMDTTAVETTAEIVTTTVEYMHLPSIDLLPLQYYLDELTSSVQSVVGMVTGIFNSLPDWVPIVYGISFSIGVGFYVINKLSG